MADMKKQSNLLSGITLIEVLISTALFVIILLGMTGIFKMILDNQRQAIATQNVQENIKYFFEVTAKEIRMAQRSSGGCPHLPAGARFATSTNAYGDILYIKNYHGQCVSYYLSDDNGVVRFKVERDFDEGFLSPAKINMAGLRFDVSDTALEQPMVTMSVSAESIGREASFSKMTVQTSITSRYYRAE